MKNAITHNCPRECGNEATYNIRLGVLPCKSCTENDRQTKVKQQPEFATQSQKDRVTQERDKHSKDLVQPWGKGNKINPDFLSAYPERAGDYFSPEQLRQV